MAALLATRLPNPPGSLVGNNGLVLADAVGTLAPRAGHVPAPSDLRVVTTEALNPYEGAAAMVLMRLEINDNELYDVTALVSAVGTAMP